MEEGRMVEIGVGDVLLEGELVRPNGASGVVLFAHGSGSGRHSPRNQYVASILRRFGIGTLLFDLLTPREEEVYRTRFDIELLTARLVGATRWLLKEPELESLPVGYFGASTGAAAALSASAQLGSRITAVVSRGGRPDLAAAALERVRAATLLLVGGDDHGVIELNEQAYARLRCEKKMIIVPGATHLFEEPGKLEQVAEAAALWFARWFEQHSSRRGLSDVVSE